MIFLPLLLLHTFTKCPGLEAEKFGHFVRMRVRRAILELLATRVQAMEVATGRAIHVPATACEK